MLIYKVGGDHYIFIHIPKNSGKYIRNLLKQNEVVTEYWGIKDSLDLAHIPFMRRHKFIVPSVKYTYVTYTRNPYDRIISAFFYRFGRTQTVQQLQAFILSLPQDFKLDFKDSLIHFYPQYLFLCDRQLRIPHHIKIMKIEDQGELPGFKLKKYNLDEFLTKECISVINKIYEQDFVRLHYDML